MANEIQRFPEDMAYKGNPSYDDKLMIYDAATGITKQTNVEDFVSAAGNNVIGTATPSDSPTGTETNGQSYRVSSNDVDQVFTNFLDADGQPITVPTPDSGLLTKTGGVWAFVKDGVDVSGLVPKTAITNDPTATDPNKVLGAGLLPNLATASTTNKILQRTSLKDYGNDECKCFRSRRSQL